LGLNGRHFRAAAMFKALGRIEFEQFAALVNAPFDTLQVLRVAVT
jgi:hypothetical protein